MSSVANMAYSTEQLEQLEMLLFQLSGNINSLTPAEKADAIGRNQFLDLASLETAEKPEKFRNALDLAIKTNEKPIVTFLDDLQKPITFTLFSKFPQEIQNRIWVAKSYQHPRVIQFIEHDVNLDGSHTVMNYSVIGARRPEFLFTCKAALNAMIGHYNPMLALQNNGYGVMICPEIDTVELKSEMWQSHFLSKLAFSTALAFPSEFKYIQNIRLELVEFMGNFARTRKVIRALPRLASVVIKENYDDVNAFEDMFLQIYFVDQYLHFGSRRSNGPRQDMTLQILTMNGALSGTQAIDFLFNYIIVDITFQTRLLEGLGRVEQMMRECPNLPGCVTGQFNYYAV